jgi:large subunit ribosomal protein L24e
MMFVRNDSKIFRFCRSKCHRHFKAKHNPRKTAWTKAFRAAKGKEMIVDKTFDFEKKRNTPERYDRDLYVKAVQAMLVASRIRQVRKERFHRLRLAAQRKLRISLAEKEISKQKDLLRLPVSKLAKSKLAAKLKKEGKLRSGPKKVEAMEE